MRDYIFKLTQDIAQADQKTRFWSAEAKKRAAENGRTSDCYRAAARYLSMWSNDLESLQEKLEAEQDEQDEVYNTEFAPVD